MALLPRWHFCHRLDEHCDDFAHTQGEHALVNCIFSSVPVFIEVAAKQRARLRVGLRRLYIFVCIEAQMSWFPMCLHTTACELFSTN